MMKRILPLLLCLYLVGDAYAQSYRLVYPKNGFVFSNDTILFKWNVVDSATSYNLEVATDSLFGVVVYSNNTSATSVQTTLPTGSAYYWRVQANTNSGQQSWSYSRMFNVFSPNQISGLSMWFDAAQNVTSSGGNVSQWADLSSSELVAAQSSPSAEPSLTSNVTQLNNKPVIYFGGSAYLTHANISMTGFTAFIVRDFTQGNPYIQYVLGGDDQGNASGICSQGEYYLNGNGAESGYGVYNSSGSPNGYFGAVTSDLVNTFSIYTTEPTKLFRNGISPTINTVSTIPNISFSCIGIKPGVPYFAYIGNLAEVIVYNDTLSDPSRLLAEGYLRCKFSNYVDLGPDTIFSKFCVSTTLKANATLHNGSTFNSYLWSTGATTPSINVTTFGTYWVQATDIFGYVSTDTMQVKPTLPFNQLPVSAHLCEYDSVVWNTNYPSTGYQFTWSDGSTAPSLVIKTAGTYYVKIKDKYGCYFYSDTVHVLVDPFPDFKMPKDTSFCAGNQLSFNYPGPLNSIQWSDGDTTIATVINTPGSYSVTAVDANACVAHDTTQVFIKGIAPSVNFTYATPCLGDTIQFTDSSQAPTGHTLVAWRWNFNNIDTSDLENPTYIFPFFGANTVSLTAITDSGCINSISKSIQVNFKPQAFFLAKLACAIAPTQFTDYSTTFAPEILTAWDWHFGTGDTSANVNPVYSFPSEGIYGVSLRVTNNDGCSDIFSDSIHVYAPFSANFTVNNVCFGDSTAFIDITKSLSVVEWLWNFGDGSTLANIPNPIHQYASAQLYTASLIVENAIGCVDSITKPVNIVNYPTADFGELITCANALYIPLDSSLSPSEPITKWDWQINGSNFDVRAPIYTFADSGSYPIKLTVTTLSGCSDSITRTVYSAPLPVVAFAYSPLYGDAPVTVTFSNITTGASAYAWNFGDNSGISNVINPEHTYTYDDTFTIKLIATSGFGCVDSASNIFIATPTFLDLSVDEVDAVDSSLSDGTSLITVNVKCSNLGTRLITDIDFYATFGGGGVISENWSGQFESGHRMVYTFTARFVSDSGINSYVCVDAISVNNGQTETRTDNNSQCNTISSEIELLGPYPNPAAITDQPTLGIILQQAGVVTINVTDMLGKYMIRGTTLNLPLGRSNFVIPAGNLAAGNYLVQVQYNDKIFVEKFMVK